MMALRDVRGFEIIFKLFINIYSFLLQYTHKAKYKKKSTFVQA